jgi:hypothetical protein
MHWETKKNLCDSLCCGDLELKLQYFRGMPVYHIKANNLFDAAHFKILMHVNIINGSNHYLWARNTPVFTVIIL